MSKPIRVRIEDQQLTRLLDKVQGRIKNPHLLMRKIAGILMDEVEENLATEGRNNGEKWQPLSPRTIKQRSKRGKWPGKMLQVSPAGLASSITQKHDAGRAIVGSNKDYAAIHQFGGQAGRGRKVKIPARDYLSPSTEGMSRVKSAVAKYMEGR